MIRGSRPAARAWPVCSTRNSFALARADGRDTVSAVTAPGNAGSIRFHESLGFTVTGPLRDYDGPGREIVLFRREL